MDQEKGIEDLPSDVLAVILKKVLFSTVPDRDYCAWCKMPYYWITRKTQSARLRGVNRRWRSTMLHRVLIASLHFASGDFCFTPIKCYADLGAYQQKMITACRNPLLRGPRNVMIPLLILGDSDSDEAIDDVY